MKSYCNCKKSLPQRWTVQGPKGSLSVSDSYPLCSIYSSQNSSSFIWSVEPAGPGRGSRAPPPPCFCGTRRLIYHPPPPDWPGDWMGLLGWRNRCLDPFRRTESHIRCRSPLPHCRRHRLRGKLTGSHDWKDDITALEDIIKTLTNGDVDATVCSFEPGGHFL